MTKKNVNTHRIRLVNSRIKSSEEEIIIDRCDPLLFLSFFVNNWATIFLLSGTLAFSKTSEFHSFDK
jgi:hypothetical protein